MIDYGQLIIDQCQPVGFEKGRGTEQVCKKEDEEMAQGMREEFGGSVRGSCPGSVRPASMESGRDSDSEDNAPIGSINDFNVHRSKRADSRNDFIHKPMITFKEFNEREV